MWETDNKQVNTDILELQIVLSAAKKTQQGAEVELKTPGVVRGGVLGKGPSSRDLTDAMK